MGVHLGSSSPLHCDNKSAMQIAHNAVFHERTKHIEVDCHFIRHHCALGTVHLLYVPSEDQVTDLFTKSLTRSRLGYLCSKLQMCSFEPVRVGGKPKPNHAPRPPAGFVLKDKILELATQGRIVIDEAENAASANPVFVQAKSSPRTRINKPRVMRKEYRPKSCPPNRPPAKVTQKTAPEKLLRQMQRVDIGHPTEETRSRN
ncbi:hypothetical protein H6P81_018864 [Aristolochia fimbriata]|uniref:Uncharacterized protein n=1 Tax=Aristolochia fimbriata TaxID=158543 RepID=A0AAV7E270_ARIFI|nr:hypothetical protein H6P81_018864 [Aristolochia fimbriata]